MYDSTFATCASSTSAPIGVDASSGSPGAHLAASAATRATNSSAIVSCTSSRDGALQDSPWLKNMLAAAAAAARSGSLKSAKTRFADLPPSSL